MRVMVGRALTDDDVPRGTTFAARADAHIHIAIAVTLVTIIVLKMPFWFIIYSKIPIFLFQHRARQIIEFT